MQLQVEQQIKTQKLPKAEIMSLDGNPLNYYLFMKTFENTVEKCTEDDSLRLQLLIQYCTGKAKETIKCRGMISGKDGYVKAKKLLEERFREKYVVLGLRSYLKGLLLTRTTVKLYWIWLTIWKDVKSPLWLRVGSVSLTLRIR